jgi:hypothetical protein
MLTTAWRICTACILQLELVSLLIITIGEMQKKERRKPLENIHYE